MSDEDRAFMAGALDALNTVLNMLNEYEDRLITKADFYHRVFAISPLDQYLKRKAQDERRQHLPPQGSVP